jgi:hypothetical protein
MDNSAAISAEYKLWVSPSIKAREGHVKMVSLMRNIFDVKEIEQDGLTDIEIMKVYSQFLGFCDEIKKNMLPSPIPATPSATLSSSLAEDRPTHSSSGSGSTENVHSTGSPMVSS